MRTRTILLALALGLSQPAAAETAHLTYTVHAAGMHVADVDVRFATGPWTYQMDIAYHTTGLVGFFYRGHQVNAVNGTWQQDTAEPAVFDGVGTWRGEHRVARIDYDQGRPIIRELLPPNEAERRPVPPDLQQHTVDSLSALLELLRTVQDTGRCDLTVRTYDGRRATEITARTGPREILAPEHGASFAGPAQRCDFKGRMLAGFKFGDRAKDSKPLHGSAWLAALVPNGPLVPVHMAFETRWFGDAVMELTGGTTEGAPPEGHPGAADNVAGK
jgi:hypothetical protein